jgi:hypothetical protein
VSYLTGNTLSSGPHVSGNTTLDKLLQMPAPAAMNLEAGDRRGLPVQSENYSAQL